VFCTDNACLHCVVCDVIFPLFCQFWLQVNLDVNLFILQCVYDALENVLRI
jgi:hypothetical protein